jgi:hypothetical protein
VRCILSLLMGGLVVISVNATPSFADEHYDACQRLAAERGESPSDAGRTYRRFMHRCLAGDIVLPVGSTMLPVRTTVKQYSHHIMTPNGPAAVSTPKWSEGWRCTISHLNGKEYCF